MGPADKMICDDCGGPAQVIISELITRGVDVLCWGCQIARAAAVAVTLAQQAEGAEQDAQRV